MRNIFIERPGYLKTGTRRLCKKLNLTKEEIYKLKQEARVHFGARYPNKEKIVPVNNIHQNNLSVKQKWVKPNGDETIHYAVEQNNSVNITEIIKNALSNINHTSNVYYSIKDLDNVAVMSIPDVHIGQYADGQSLNSQLESYKSVCLNLFNSIIESNCSEIIFPIGSDYFNTDTKFYTTSNNTQQHNNSTWKEMYSSGLKTLIEIINIMSEKINVTLIHTSGNHDEILSYTLSETLRLYFENNKRVTTIKTNNPRTYILKGVNLFGFTHGKDEKQQNLPNIMAYEAKELWGKSKYMDFFHGHLHTEIVKDIFGVRIISLPSLAIANEWAKQKGYMSNSGAKAYIYSKTNGPTKYIQINT